MQFPWFSENLLELLAARDRLPFALLLTGEPGVGKSAFADALSGALLCESPESDGRACGRCAACGWFAAGNHPDFRRIGLDADDDGKPAREIRIEQIRGLDAFTGVAGHRGARRIVVLDPAERLNDVSANALLKTLEEPSRGLMFVLVTSRPDFLPATIRSRCRLHPLPPPSPALALEWLRAQTGAAADEAAGWLAAAAGAPLHARALAEPATAAAHRAMVEAIGELPDTPSVTVAERLAAHEPRAWLPVLQRWVVDLGRIAAGAAPHYFPGRGDRLAALAKRLDAAGLARVEPGLRAQSRWVGHPLNAKLFCEESLEIYLNAFRR